MSAREQLLKNTKDIQKLKCSTLILDEKIYYGSNINQAPIKANKGSFFIITNNGLETGSIIDTYVFTKTWEKIGGIELSDIPTFDPQNYDLEEFTNSTTNKFLRSSDVVDASESQRGLVNTNTTNAQQLGNGNKVIKGGATGNALEIKTSENEKIAEFLATKGAVFYSNNLSGKALSLRSSYYNKEIFWNSGDGIFRFITDPQSNTIWFGGSNTLLEYRRNQMYYRLHLQDANYHVDNKGVIEINNYRGAVLAGSHNLHLRVNASSYNVGNDVLTILTNQNVGIGTTTPQAKLDITSTTSGFLPPRMTQAQRGAIVSPTVGLHVYQTDAVEGMYVYKSTGWKFAY